MAAAREGPAAVQGLRKLVAHGRSYGDSVQAAAAAATALTVYERGPVWAQGQDQDQDRDQERDQDRDQEQDQDRDQERDQARKPQQPREATPAEVLCEAAKNGDVPAVEEALEDLKTWDAETRDRVKAEAAALGWAAGSGNIEILRLLVARGQFVNADPGMPDPADKLGRTALHWAARKGQLEAVQVLVEEFRVDMNACMKEGTSVFHYAVYGDAQHVCEYLRARGADVHHINQHGCNAAQWAALTGSCAMFRYLASSCGLDLNVRSKNGHTVLHKTAQRGHLDACRWLVHQLPHLVAARDKEGSTAADLAGLNAHRPVADFLRNPNAGTVSSENEISET
ncbi:Ankyrin repeat domain-containing protein 1 [Hondaea fermentalgiana]|uniref:Ankyrin repeat domain-containing protein 1 n=1 Tax=Hondaea fermentalgiana TaxID=2315210 RepID=A0A2R5GT10_9STRA|nr:Ankyrin repeat domain-containing protein 1 [Hondaea fermentalgiana]|eukprot:GBG33725.1 Ankyrin repeat domain-containing protein 1 [Hondaea fermentalgiana]